MSDVLQASISASVEVLDGEVLVGEAVRIMKERCISSVLVSEGDLIAGIITERDIVHKFTLLEKEDKLTARVRALMTRPVQVAKLETLVDDMIRVHQRYSCRHFPVMVDDSMRLTSLFGIISFTDLAQNYLDDLGKPARKEKKNQTYVAEVGLLASKSQDVLAYTTLFSALNFRIHQIHLPFVPGQVKIPGYCPLIADLDHLAADTMLQLVDYVKKHQGAGILLTSDARIAAPLEQSHTGSRIRICMKPLDLRVINQIIRDSSLKNY